MGDSMILTFHVPQLDGRDYAIKLEVLAGGGTQNVKIIESLLAVPLRKTNFIMIQENNP